LAKSEPRVLIKKACIRIFFALILHIVVKGSFWGKLKFGY